MSITKKIRFEIINEGQQIKDALTQRFDGNIIQMFNFLTDDNISSISFNQYLRRLRHDPHSKFVKQIELIFERPYRTIVKTVEFQLEEVINHMSANIGLYNDSLDRDVARKLCELSSSYCTDRRTLLAAEINRLILYGQAGIHDTHSFENYLHEALQLNHIDLVLRGCAEIIEWNLMSEISRDTAADFLISRQSYILNWPNTYKSDYYRLIGQSKYKSGSNASASTFLKRSCDASDDPYKIALSSLLLADCYIKKEMVGKARKILRRIHNHLTFLSPDILANIHLGFAKCSLANHQYAEAQSDILTAFWIIEESEVNDLTRIEVLSIFLRTCHFSSPDLVIQVFKQLPLVLKAHVDSDEVTYIFNSAYAIADKSDDTRRLFWSTLKSCLSDHCQSEFVTRNKAALFDLYIHHLRNH